MLREIIAKFPNPRNSQTFPAAFIFTLGKHRYRRFASISTALQIHKLLYTRKYPLMQKYTGLLSMMFLKIYFCAFHSYLSLHISLIAIALAKVTSSAIDSIVLFPFPLSVTAFKRWGKHLSCKAHNSVKSLIDKLFIFGDLARFKMVFKTGATLNWN